MINPDLVALKQRVLDTKQEFNRWAQANVAEQSAAMMVNVGYAKARNAYWKALKAYDAALAKESGQ